MIEFLRRLLRQPLLPHVCRVTIEAGVSINGGTPHYVQGVTIDDGARLTIEQEVRLIPEGPPYHRKPDPIVITTPLEADEFADRIADIWRTHRPTEGI